MLDYLVPVLSFLSSIVTVAHAFLIKDPDLKYTGADTVVRILMLVYVFPSQFQQYVFTYRRTIILGAGDPPQPCDNDLDAPCMYATLLQLTALTSLIRVSGLTVRRVHAYLK